MNTKIFVSLTDTAKEWLVREAYNPADGARPLRDTARAWVPGLQLGKRTCLVRSSAYTGSHFAKGAAAVRCRNRMVGPPSSWSRDQEESIGRLGQWSVGTFGSSSSDTAI